MARLGDILYFLRQIFFPNWTDREDDSEPTRLQKWLAALFLFLSSRGGTGTAFSVILHIFILVILALLTFPQLTGFASIDILGDFKIPGVEQAAIVNTEKSEDGGESQDTIPDDPTPEPVAEQIPGESTVPDEPNVEMVDTLPGEQRLKIQATGGFVEGGGFQNRNPAGRQRAMQGGGSSQGSEEAVEAALRWFVAHQMNDGGWSLYLEGSCRCSHRGTSPTNRRTAATALALLSFLGAGYSHQTPSPYRSNVERGLLFLVNNPDGGYDGAAIESDRLQMYSRGLAAMALCEAYAMTREQDPKSSLGVAAQKSLFFIETAQDSAGGGWRYRPNMEPGDTSVFAWQLMALKSGKIGGLHVSQSVLYAAQDFLDSVALEGGRHYQYLPTGEWDAIRGDDSPMTCTAIGLLSRMYLGWKPGDPFLDDGMEQLARWGHTPRPGATNLYYAYYATLAMHHYGSEHWDSWNGELQDWLIRTQSRQGCESGSWFFPDAYCDVGGRLLNTALAVMILETPYRFMPLYREIR